MVDWRGQPEVELEADLGVKMTTMMVAKRRTPKNRQP
jgi:hypothetical protein